MAGNLLSDAAIETLRADHRKLAGLKSARKQGPPPPNNYDGPDWFLARITGWAPIIANARWKYAWQEILIESDGDIICGGGLSGTTSDYYALNLTEMNNVPDHSGTQGNSVNQTSNYPPNYHLLPVGGGTGGVVANQVIVVMYAISDTGQNFRPVFEYQNTDQGPCS